MKQHWCKPVSLGRVPSSAVLCGLQFGKMPGCFLNGYPYSHSQLQSWVWVSSHLQYFVACLFQMSLWVGLGNSLYFYLHLSDIFLCGCVFSYTKGVGLLQTRPSQTASVTLSLCRLKNFKFQATDGVGQQDTERIFGLLVLRHTLQSSIVSSFQTLNITSHMYFQLNYLVNLFFRHEHFIMVKMQVAKLSCGVFKMLKSNKGDTASSAVYEELEPFKIWRRMNLCPSFYIRFPRLQALSWSMLHRFLVPKTFQKLCKVRHFHSNTKTLTLSLCWWCRGNSGYNIWQQDASQWPCWLTVFIVPTHSQWGT